MRKIFPLLFLITFSFTSYAQKDKDSIHASIVKFFDGLSEVNPEKLKAYSTSDFILLEDGHVWNIDTLINKISFRKNSNITRINKFDFIRTDQRDNIAWVSYHNTADFRLNEKQQTVRWLESVVLEKENARWKIKMMHSTRLKP